MVYTLDYEEGSPDMVLPNSNILSLDIKKSILRISSHSVPLLIWCTPFHQPTMDSRPSSHSINMAMESTSALGFLEPAPTYSASQNQYMPHDTCSQEETSQHASMNNVSTTPKPQSQQDWENIKHLVRVMYIEEGRTLAEVIHTLRRKYKLVVT